MPLLQKNLVIGRQEQVARKSLRQEQVARKSCQANQGTAHHLIKCYLHYLSSQGEVCRHVDALLVARTGEWVKLRTYSHKVKVVINYL